MQYKFLKYMLYQRTYIREHSLANRLRYTIPYRIVRKAATWCGIDAYKALVILRATVDGNRIYREYLTSIDKDYEDIARYLPNENDPIIIDIGSGIAGIDIKLYHHYGTARLILVDKSHVERIIWYDFMDKGAYYNNLQLASEFLQLHSVRRDSIQLVEADDFHKLSLQADLIISLASWGYHYPIRTYVALVHDLLKQGGVLIIDIREGSAGIEELERMLGPVEIISKSEADALLRVRAVKRTQTDHPLHGRLGENDNQ